MGCSTLFGEPSRFAIEVGETKVFEGQPYCHFRFWIGGLAVGDWDDFISLRASGECMRTFCKDPSSRIVPRFATQSAQTVFNEVYEQFFTADYSMIEIEVPNLRDRFHMDQIGQSAVTDKAGIVLVGLSWTEALLIVKDFTHGGVVSDFHLPFGEVESVGQKYANWAASQLANAID